MIIKLFLYILLNISFFLCSQKSNVLLYAGATCFFKQSDIYKSYFIFSAMAEHYWSSFEMYSSFLTVVTIWICQVKLSLATKPKTDLQ